MQTLRTGKAKSRLHAATNQWSAPEPKPAGSACPSYVELRKEKSMNSNAYQTRQPDILENALIRTPQKEAFAALVDFASADAATLAQLVTVLERL